MGWEMGWGIKWGGMFFGAGGVEGRLGHGVSFTFFTAPLVLHVFNK